VFEVRHVWIDDGVQLNKGAPIMVLGAMSPKTAPRNSIVSDIKSAHGEWLRFPNSIRAPSPFDRTELCVLEISHQDTCKAARAGRSQPAFELWGIVLGNPPPVPGVEARNDLLPGPLASIKEAHACFRGIERPLAHPAGCSVRPSPHRRDSYSRLRAQHPRASRISRQRF
jgi:hypothetical protein